MGDYRYCSGFNARSKTRRAKSPQGEVRKRAEGDDDLHKRSVGSQGEVSRYPKCRRANYSAHGELTRETSIRESVSMDHTEETTTKDSVQFQKSTGIFIIED